MSSLRDRMNRLRGVKAEEAASPSVEVAAPIADGSPRVESGIISEPLSLGTEPVTTLGNTASAGPEWEALGVRLVVNRAGECLERRIMLPLEHRSGHHRLSEWAQTADRLYAFHPEAKDAPRLDDVLFLDLETTGLGAGTGNVPFMMGLAYYEGNQFVLRQFLIRHPAEERAMLTELCDLLPRFRWLGTYNGRSFDWPLVQTRLIMNGLGRDMPELLHLDFLHPSRSIWRNTLVSCRLSHVEEERLGIHRSEDVPGSLAPALYFQYLAEGSPEVLKGVFLHNEQDMVTLACLGIRFGHLLAGRIGSEVAMPEESEELLRTGLWLEKHGCMDTAELLFTRLENSERADAAAWHALAMRDKRTGNWHRAVLLWQKAAVSMEESAAPAWDAHVELAMFYEHKQKNFLTALLYTEGALELALRSPYARMDAKRRAELDALRRRRDRLKRKCGPAADMLEVN